MKHVIRGMIEGFALWVVVVFILYQIHLNIPTFMP